MLRDTLLQLTFNLKHAYIILDALDEGNDIQEITELLQDLQKNAPIQLHILVSSRELQDIYTGLGHIATHLLKLQGSEIDSDIQLYIRTRLRCDPKLSLFPAELIETTLVDQAKGM